MRTGQPGRGTHLPGEYYFYNNRDFKGEYCSIDGEASGVERTDTDGYYQYEKSQSQYPAYHFRMSARDLALYGQ